MGAAERRSWRGGHGHEEFQRKNAGLADGVAGGIATSDDDASQFEIGNERAEDATERSADPLLFHSVELFERFVAKRSVEERAFSTRKDLGAGLDCASDLAIGVAGGKLDGIERDAGEAVPFGVANLAFGGWRATARYDGDRPF